jgi:hypothetical protein
MRKPFDFAFLDVDATNGMTFEVAKALEAKGVPYAFLSGSQPENLPEELRPVPFIPKPFQRSQIEKALLVA